MNESKVLTTFTPCSICGLLFEQVKMFKRWNEKYTCEGCITKYVDAS